MLNSETIEMLYTIKSLNTGVSCGNKNVYANGYGIVQDITQYKGQELVDLFKKIMFKSWDIIETEYECIGCGRTITLAEILKDGITGSSDLSRRITSITRGRAVVCDACLDDGTVRECDICHTYHRADEMEYLPNYDMSLCPHCYDTETVSCKQCGEIIIPGHDSYYIHINDDYYCCSDCAIAYGYTTCDVCGDWVHEDNIYMDDDGEARCSDCHDDYIESQEVNDEEDNGEYVKSYSWKPNPQFKCMTDDPTPHTYYGFELEVSGAQREAPAFLDFFGDSHDIHDNVYLKSDCSIIDGGFEIVTHPMTAEYLRKEFKPRLASGLKYLRQCHFRGHNKGGMHIHVSRRAITSKMFGRMCDLLYNSNNKDKWLVLTQRKELELDRWATLGRDKYDERCTFDDGYSSSNRYIGMNLTNHTVEFRIFNSNLRLERVLKNLELVEALVNFSKTKYKPTMRMFLGYIKAHKQRYNNAYDFIIEKNWNSKQNKFVTEENETIEV